MPANAGAALFKRLGFEELKREGHNIYCACIACDSEDGMGVHEDEGIAHCWGCDGKWSRLSLCRASGLSDKDSWDLLVEIGLEQPRHQRNGEDAPKITLKGQQEEKPDTSILPGGNDQAFLYSIAQAKHMPLDSLKAYGGEVAKRDKQWGVRFPFYNGEGTKESHFDLRATGKGLCKKGGKTGVFLPGRAPMPGETWFIVEGVKDAAALHGLGQLALGVNGNTLKKDHVPLLKGVNVLICPDQDAKDQGLSGAKKTAFRIHDVAATVLIMTLPIKEGDVRDVLQLPGGGDLLAKAIADAQPWKTDDLPKSPYEDLGSHGHHLTDLGNAKRFAEQHGTELRYCHGWKKWYAWDGRRWSDDPAGRIDQLADKTIESMYAESLDVALGDKESEALQKWASTCEGGKYLRSMVDISRSFGKVPVRWQEFDADPWLLNCQNGIVDLRTGELRDHDHRDLISKIAPVDFVRQPIPIWDGFLDRIFAGDEDLIAYIQRLLGSTLVGEVFEHILPVFYGTGANGKGTLVETVLAILGDYGNKAPQGFLMAKKHEDHPTDRADLCGRRFVVASETGEGQRLSEDLIKELTGGDTISARRMREDPWSFKPSHSLVMITNHRPAVRGTDHGIWRRLRLIPFLVTIPDEEMDKELPKKLRREYPGILSWMVDGCLDWQGSGLSDPVGVLEATKGYRQDQDILGIFIEEKCIVSPNYIVRASELYGRYRNWAEANGEYAVSQTKFGRAMTERGFERVRGTTVDYVGITAR